jgi:hypothetical protein
LISVLERKRCFLILPRNQRSFDEEKRQSVNFNSVDEVLKFIEEEMVDKMLLNSRARVLENESMQLELVGREETIQSAIECFHFIMQGSASDRTRRPIPVCSGLSGLGKTRMLEEGDHILTRCGITEKKLCVIVPYYNGHEPQPVEQNMHIEASFSWRLLHRVFIEGNGKELAEWFRSCIPSNAAQLTLDLALQIIYRKLVNLGLIENALFYLFLGIDEYQKIHKVNCLRKDPEISILRELMQSIGNYISVSRKSGLVLLPMFAGTDWDVISGSSIANSSYFLTKRLPMKLLSKEEIKLAIRKHPKFSCLLKYSAVHRHLFYLGGVPRWIVDYLLELQRRVDLTKDPFIPLEKLNETYSAIWSLYISSYFTELDSIDLIKLAAYSLSSELVHPDDMFNGNGIRWSRMRDSSLCMLVEHIEGMCRVLVPYTLFIRVSQIPICEKMKTGERRLIESLYSLHRHVDEVAYDLQPWQLWEKFGAYFYALRINSLIVIGRNEVYLSQLLHGAIMTDDILELKVQLIPTKVFSSFDILQEETPRFISCKGNVNEKMDWSTGECIVVNGDSGPGVDIFFALRSYDSSRVIFFLDQRKRIHGSFTLAQALKDLEAARIIPCVLGSSNIINIQGVLNCLPDAGFTKERLPDFSFIVTRKELPFFYGSLAIHPACSPLLHVNVANKSALEYIFTGKDSKKLVDVVLQKRKDPEGGFESIESLDQFVKSQKLDVHIDKDSTKYLDFSI